MRQKTLELIYQKGDIPDYNLLWCYGIFGDSQTDYADKIPQDARFDTYIDLASYIKTTESDYEKVMIISCVSVAMLLKGEGEKAVRFFLCHIIYVSLTEMYMEGLNTFVLDFLFIIGFRLIGF